MLLITIAAVVALAVGVSIVVAVRGGSSSGDPTQGPSTSGPSTPDFPNGAAPTGGQSFRSFSGNGWSSGYSASTPVGVHIGRYSTAMTVSA